MNAYFADNNPSEDHVQKSLRGGAFSMAARGINAAIQIGSVIVLARMLSPEDYGLVAMVTAFTGFAGVLTDLGTRDAITQRARITPGEVSALFWVTMTIGVTFCVLAASSGPLLAAFYGEPRLKTIVMVSSLTFVSCALTVQHSALLRRALMFRELAVIEIVANLVSASLAVTAAFLGASYWALIVRPIGTPLIMAAGLWMTCRWLPGRATMTPAVKESVKFGLNITGFCLTDFAGRSADRVAIGYRSGPVGLGHYQSAMFIYDNLLDVLVYPLHGVAVASLSKLSQNLPQLRAAWAKALAAVAFYSMPAYGLLAVTSIDVVVLLLGKKWASAGVLLSVLAFRGIPHSLERTIGWLHVTAGRTDRWRRYGLFLMTVQFTAVLCGLPFGPMGIAVAYVISMFIIFLPAIGYAGRPLGISAGDALKIVWPQLVATLASAALGIMLRRTVLADMNPLARTAALGMTFLTTYLVLVVGVFRVHAPLRTVQSLLRGFLPLRFTHLLGPTFSPADETVP